MTRSAEVSRSRPFYAAHAEVYDLLVTDPVEPWVDAIEAATSDATGVRRVLDAGCGTGRYAAAMIARGWDVELVDAAPELVKIAARRCPEAIVRVADLTCLAPAVPFDAVACRGVLNDLVDVGERRAALGSMAAQLGPRGRLVLDVREREAARRRADGIPRRRTVPAPGGGTVTFTSTTSWAADRLLVHEQHELRPADGRGEPAPPHDYRFTMRPWSEDELRQALRAVGLTRVSVRPGVGRRTGDRLLVVAGR